MENMGGNSLNQMSREKKSVVPAVHSSIGLWMIVDGIGLVHSSRCYNYGRSASVEKFVSFVLVYTKDLAAILVWWSISSSLWINPFAASFQMFPVLELIGMVLISSGPLLNMVACYLFTDNDDPHYLYKKEWASTELVELTGMLILDVSLIHMEEIYVLIAEVTGFLVLCCAAGLQFTYQPKILLPSVSFRLDLVHSSECVGLIILTLVAFAQYRMKLHKLEHQQRVQERHRATHGSPTLTTIKSHNASQTRHRANSISHPSTSPASVVDIEQPAVDKTCGRNAVVYEDEDDV